MAKDEIAARLAKLQRLMPIMLDLQEKLSATLEEFDELLGGGAGIGAKLKTFQTAFDGAWGDRYARGEAGKYLWNFKADVPNMKKIIKALGLEECLERIPRFFRDDYTGLVTAKHPFGWFVRQINTYVAPATSPDDFTLDAPTVAGCKHEPRCKSDQDHTSRKMADMRSMPA